MEFKHRYNLLNFSFDEKCNYLELNVVIQYILNYPIANARKLITFYYNLIGKMVECQEIIYLFLLDIFIIMKDQMEEINQERLHLGCDNLRLYRVRG